MTHFLVLLLALLIGVVAGLRALTAPAVVAWAAMLDWINLDGTWAQWLGHPITVAVLTVLAVGELNTDKLPKTPSRKTPMQFVARLLHGKPVNHLRVSRRRWINVYGCQVVGLIDRCACVDRDGVK